MRTVITALAYVGFDATAPDKWIDFGPRVIGAPLWRPGPLSKPGPKNTALLRLDERAYRIAVSEADRDGLAYLGWEVRSAAELDELEDDLRRKGLAVDRADTTLCEARMVQGMISLVDPVGTRVEVVYGHTRMAEPFAPARNISGFLAGALGAGHIVINVPDLEPARRFYADVLGFRVTDVWQDRMVFMGCNPRHHSIALRRDPEVGINHMMIETRSIDDVGMTFDVCQRGEVKTSRLIGRHSNDRMFSFYVQTPGGFDIEYGSGGRLITDERHVTETFDRPSVWGHKRPDGGW